MLTATLAAWFAAAASAAAPAAPVDAGIGRLVERSVPQRAQGVVAVVRDGEFVHCAGFHGPRGCNERYDIGSITKQFTAAAAVRLASQERLGLRDRIGEHLEGVPADKQGITVHQLLTHTAGFVPSVGPDGERLTRPAFLDRALASPLRSAPGARYRYSNVGYSVLTAILERVTGRPYEALLSEHLLVPAGLTRTGYRGRAYWNLRGNGGLHSSARDMVRWHLALEGTAVLSAAEKRTLFRPRVDEDAGGESRYAYGWVVLRTPLGRALWHNGGNGRAYAELLRLPRAGTMIFWATADVRRLERRNLTNRIAKHLLPGARAARAPAR